MQDVYVWEGTDLGGALRARRKELGMLQAQVAADLGFSARLVSEIENGRDTVAYGKILRYASYLGLDLVLRSRG